jgi:hypothetical protein
MDTTENKMSIQEAAERFMNANQALVDTESRHAVGQAAMTDPRIAQLVALFKLSDERGKFMLLALAGIWAERYPKEA